MDKEKAEQDKGGFIKCGVQRRLTAEFGRRLRAGLGEMKKSEQKLTQTRESAMNVGLSPRHRAAT